MHSQLKAVFAGAAVVIGAACSPTHSDSRLADTARVAGDAYTVKDSTIESTYDASGTATPVRQATLSTKLMGTVTAVLVREGETVAAGQPLVRIDARDLAAKQAQIAASIAEAGAMRREALAQAGRIRALYADSAATRAQLDAVETALARAEAGVHAAAAGAAELEAVSTYSVVRAPFAGVVTRRFVDPGAFAAPGAPLVAVQDGARLRLTVTATPEATRALRRGQTIDATVEGRPVTAVVEGMVPALAGNMYSINALIDNREGRFLPGSVAILRLPAGTRTALVVPVRAITRAGDLSGVTIRTERGDEVRWVRLGRGTADLVEVDAGLRAGDVIVVPRPVPSPVATRS